MEEHENEIITSYSSDNEESVDHMQLDGVFVPILGMIFDTDHQAYTCYNSYARTIGFSVRKLRSERDRSSGLVKRVQFCCSCEGYYNKKMTPKKKRAERRFGCKAMLGLKLNPEGKYVVTKFVVEHTHELIPTSSSHILRSQRTIEPSQVGLITKMHSAGLKSSQIYSYMTAEVGGSQHLNFIQSDCQNFVQKRRVEFLKRGDSECLLEYFKQKQIENKFFFYAIRTNEDNEIRGCFFCDAQSKCDYGTFGDVVCFDTTFKTNNYNMVCAPIIGINNHGQTILFGCGLLDGETTDACVWLFNTFLQAMGGKKPKTIFTDQAQSISKALSEVFPETHHRLCLWHIYQNAAKNLSHVFGKFKTFSQQFRKCIYDPETVEEFESSWGDLLDAYELRENSWLKGIYELREKWAQVYGRSHFCAGMTTTQRSESINKFLKKYFARNLILREFVVQYDKAVADRREKERLAEVATAQTRPNLLSDWDVLIEASKKYTRKLFHCFQDEYQKILDLRMELESNDGETCIYSVLKLGARERRRLLTYVPSTQSISCSCKLFEFQGILCTHALKLFRDIDLKSLPPQYYLKRWSNNARDEIVIDQCGEVVMSDPDPSYIVQYSELSHIAQRIVAKFARGKYAFAKSGLLELEANLESLATSEQHPGTYGDITSANHDNVSRANLKLQDPKIIKGRGRPKGRIKNALESKHTKINALSKRKDSKKSNVHKGDGEHALDNSGLGQNQFNNELFRQGACVSFGFPTSHQGDQVLHPMQCDYPFVNSQAMTQFGHQVPVRQLNFSEDGNP